MHHYYFGKNMIVTGYIAGAGEKQVEVPETDNLSNYRSLYLPLRFGV